MGCLRTHLADEAGSHFGLGNKKGNSSKTGLAILSFFSDKNQSVQLFSIKSLFEFKVALKIRNKNFI